MEKVDKLDLHTLSCVRISVFNVSVWRIRQQALWIQCSKGDNNCQNVKYSYNSKP